MKNKIEIKSVSDYLVQINARIAVSKKNKKRSMLIIGGASFMIRGLFPRKYTTDIDSFEILNNWEIKGIRNILKDQERFINIFNSESYNYIIDLLMQVDTREFELVYEYKYLDVFIPPIDASIAMKIISYAETSKRREKDMIDISNEEVYSLSKPKKVKEYLVAYITARKQDNEKEKYLMSCYDEWIKNSQ